MEFLWEVLGKSFMASVVLSLMNAILPVFGIPLAIAGFIFSSALGILILIGVIYVTLKTIEFIFTPS